MCHESEEQDALMNSLTALPFAGDIETDFASFMQGHREFPF